MLDSTYANRSAYATPENGVGATFFGVDFGRAGVSPLFMFDQHEFLAEVEKRAKNRAEVLRHLGLPSSRSPQLFNRDHDDPRRLKLDEAVKLSEIYGVPITGPMASADSLVPILEVSLRYAPKDWTETDVRRLAEEIEGGLKLWRSFVANRPMPDRRESASVSPGDLPPNRRG